MRRLYAGLTVVWKFATAPWRNDNHKYLSLARLVFSASVAVFLICALGAKLSTAAVVGFGLLWLLCWGDIATSKLSAEVLRILAGRWGIPGGAESAAPTLPETEGEAS